VTDALVLPGYERPRGLHPPLASPGYRSTILRAPAQPLVVLPHNLTEVTGPLLGEGRVRDTDADLTRQHAGEALGQRIVVHGRVLDSDGRPVPAHAGGDLAGERVRPVQPRAGHLGGAAGPELHRWWPHADRRPGAGTGS